MSIRIQIPTPMRQHTEGKATVEVNGSTVQAALDDLGQKFPGINARIFDKGEVRRFVNVYLNDEDIRYLDSLATTVKDGDELAIIPAVAGG
jgi:molybdopterin converting factor small subunit